jgi:hypothetical protein
MTRNDRVGDSAQSSVPEMHIGSADFTELDLQKRGVRFQFRE